jgi:hypothetical protein
MHPDATARFTERWRFQPARYVAMENAAARAVIEAAGGKKFEAEA